MCSHEHAHSRLETVYCKQAHVAAVQFSCAQNKLTIIMHAQTHVTT